MLVVVETKGTNANAPPKGKLTTSNDDQPLSKDWIEAWMDKLGSGGITDPVVRAKDQKALDENSTPTNTHPLALAQSN